MSFSQAAGLPEDHVDSSVRTSSPASLALLTPTQRGMVLAIMQADRCGRGGEDLENLAKPSRFAHNDPTGSAQLSQRLAMLSQWPRPSMQRQ